MSKTFIAHTLEELKPIINYIVDLSNNYNHFCFHAEMGSGKTTLITKVCEELGVLDHISSPTYSIVNEYKGSTKEIHHFDLYRLNDEIELLDIGIEEILDKEIICFIEWPEKIINFLPTTYVQVNIEVINEVRNITISTTN